MKFRSRADADLLLFVPGTATRREPVGRHLKGLLRLLHTRESHEANVIAAHGECLLERAMRHVNDARF